MTMINLPPQPSDALTWNNETDRYGRLGSAVLCLIATMEELEHTILSTPLDSAHTDRLIGFLNKMKEKIANDGIDLKDYDPPSNLVRSIVEVAKITSEDTKEEGLICMRRSEVYGKTSAAKFFKDGWNGDKLLDDIVQVDPKAWAIASPEIFPALRERHLNSFMSEALKKRIQEMSIKEFVFTDPLVNPQFTWTAPYPGDIVDPRLKTYIGDVIDPNNKTIITS